MKETYRRNKCRENQRGIEDEGEDTRKMDNN
jgi:hypothetical protein